MKNEHSTSRSFTNWQASYLTDLGHGDYKFRIDLFRKGLVRRNANKRSQKLYSLYKMDENLRSVSSTIKNKSEPAHNKTQQSGPSEDSDQRGHPPSD